jgi:hypothetical protein
MLLISFHGINELIINLKEDVLVEKILYRQSHLVSVILI